MTEDRYVQAATHIFALLSAAGFEIGGEDQLAAFQAKYPSEPEDREGAKRLVSDWDNLLADLQIRSGTLLKTDSVSFLLGAGASKDCGGPLIGTIPLEVERALLETAIHENTASSDAETPKERDAGISADATTDSGELPIAAWLRCFYIATKRVGGVDVVAPTTHEEILVRREEVVKPKAKPLSVNLESLLSLLHRWRAALPATGGCLQLDGTPRVDQPSTVIDECLRRVTSELAKLCRLPTQGAAPSAFAAYKDLLRKVLTRPLTLKRVNFFTLNYDTLVEQAADADGIVLIDGFVGTMRRTFRPESYDHDLYFPAETTEGRVHRLDRVLHLFKLHGSLTWTAEEPSWENPRPEHIARRIDDGRLSTVIRADNDVQASVQLES